MQQGEMWSEVLQRLMGLKLVRFDEVIPSDKQNIPYRLYYSDEYHHTANLPPLTLDTLHEAEARLDAEQQVQYASFLHELYRGQRHYLHIDFDVLHTAAEQRLLALWRTIGR